MNDFHSYAEPLVGHKLASVENVRGSWFFQFSGNISVETEAAWRLVSDGRIVVTSDDHGHQFGLPAPIDAADKVLTLLSVEDIKAAEIDSVSGDLTIVFSGGAHLQLLQMSSGYESWKISVRGTETICMGGGTIAHFP